MYRYPRCLNPALNYLTLSISFAVSTVSLCKSTSSYVLNSAIFAVVVYIVWPLPTSSCNCSQINMWYSPQRGSI